VKDGRLPQGHPPPLPALNRATATNAVQPVRGVAAVLRSYDTCDPGTRATDFDYFSDGGK
jgi:hypothetical protein